MTTPHQKAIINFANSNNGKINKDQAVELIGKFYYCNERKHVGDVLSRMVKNNLLKRIKNGFYEINQNKQQTVKGIINPDQLNLL